MRILTSTAEHFAALIAKLNASRAVEGSQEKVLTADLDSQQALNGILKELKIMNLHLQLITDEHIKRTEVS